MSKLLLHLFIYYLKLNNLQQPPKLNTKSNVHAIANKQKVENKKIKKKPQYCKNIDW